MRSACDLSFFLSSLAKSNGGILFKIKWRDLIQNQIEGFDSTLQKTLFINTP
jgi:hypothetical protein